ncbi:MAG: putative Type pilus pilin [Parcubacteria group bacterium]|nr:putative Type pilus pilin [Parcubacteria group bacterium]
MRSRTHSAGFTLIELLVVIAIIGILSAVVLASLGTARAKGNDASIRANLVNARGQAELFYTSNGDAYVVTAGGASDMCSATGLANGVKGVYTFLAAAANAGGGTVKTLVTDTNVPDANVVLCHATPNVSSGPYAPYNAWAMEAPLKGTYAGYTNPFFCVDSSGFAGIWNHSSLASGDAKCM